MVNKKMAILPVIALFILVLGSNVGQAASSEKVPDFILPSVPAAKEINIRDYRGKVVLVTFWATWCGPCVQEIPSLISLQNDYGPKGFTVIGISMDQGGPRIVEKLMNKVGVNYPVVMGDSKVSRAFGGIYGIPASFLVDQSGNIVKRHTGWVSHETLDAEVKKLM